MAMLVLLIYILIVVIVGLVLFAIAQIKLAGIKVKDFWSFIEANQMLDKLYAFTKEYEKLTIQEQIIYLKQAEENEKFLQANKEKVLTTSIQEKNNEKMIFDKSQNLMKLREIQAKKEEIHK